MNYKTLFRDKTTLQGPNFICRLFPISEPISSASEERYPVLFVLTGELQLFSDDEGVHTICAPEMVIAERSRIAHAACAPNTIVMEYRLPVALTTQFTSLPKPITPAVPITGRLETWVEDRLLKRPSGILSDGEELVDMLILYQPRRMQNLIDTLRNYAAESGFLRQLRPRR